MYLKYAVSVARFVYPAKLSSRHIFTNYLMYFREIRLNNRSVAWISMYLKQLVLQINPLSSEDTGILLYVNEAGIF